MVQYHIHVDAERVSEAFRVYLTREQGFTEWRFAENPAGVESFAPLLPFTFKTEDTDEFHSVFDAVERSAGKAEAMQGYIEGELELPRHRVAQRPFRRSARTPFRIERRFLPPGTFRQSEIHLTLDSDASSPELRASLREMGLLVARIAKAGSTCEVYTIQGMRREIDAVLGPLIEYLESAGGCVGGEIWEERIVRWWKSAPDTRLPPVIGAIQVR